MLDAGGLGALCIGQTYKSVQAAHTTRTRISALSRWDYGGDYITGGKRDLRLLIKFLQLKILHGKINPSLSRTVFATVQCMRIFVCKLLSDDIFYLSKIRYF